MNTFILVLPTERHTDKEEHNVKDKVSTQFALRKKTSLNVRGKADIMNNYVIFCMRRKMNPSCILLWKELEIVFDIS